VGIPAEDHQTRIGEYRAFGRPDHRHFYVFTCIPMIRATILWAALSIIIFTSIGQALQLLTVALPLYEARLLLLISSMMAIAYQSLEAFIPKPL
jgi:hypothetical protein